MAGKGGISGSINRMRIRFVNACQNNKKGWSICRCVVKLSQNGISLGVV